MAELALAIVGIIPVAKGFLQVANKLNEAKNASTEMYSFKLEIENISGVILGFNDACKKAEIHLEQRTKKKTIKQMKAFMNHFDFTLRGTERAVDLVFASERESSMIQQFLIKLKWLFYKSSIVQIRQSLSLLLACANLFISNQLCLELSRRIDGLIQQGAQSTNRTIPDLEMERECIIEQIKNYRRRVQEVSKSIKPDASGFNTRSLTKLGRRVTREAMSTVNQLEHGRPPFRYQHNYQSTDESNGSNSTFLTEKQPSRVSYCQICSQPHHLAMNCDPRSRLARRTPQPYRLYSSNGHPLEYLQPFAVDSSDSLHEETNFSDQNRSIENTSQVGPSTTNHPYEDLLTGDDPISNSSASSDQINTNSAQSDQGYNSEQNKAEEDSMRNQKPKRRKGVLFGNTMAPIGLFDADDLKRRRARVDDPSSDSE